MAKFLDESGLSYFYGKLKSKYAKLKTNNDFVTNNNELNFIPKSAVDTTNEFTKQGDIYFNYRLVDLDSSSGIVKNIYFYNGSGKVGTDNEVNLMAKSFNGYNIEASVPADAKFTDTKVTNTLATTTKAYITGTTSSSTNTDTQVFDTGVYLDTTAGTIVAKTFKTSTGIEIY